MPANTAQKLRIKERDILLTVNAPAGFRENLDPPSTVKISSSVKNYDQIHWFVKNKAEMEKDLKKIMGLMKDHVICWIYFPKGTSGIQTDLTRDKGWDGLLKNEQLQWVSLISFNDTWTSFGMRLKTDADVKKESKPGKQRAIFDYIDSDKKIIRLPADFEKELVKHKEQLAFFNQLSFTNKKEYVEWIVSAKKEETRTTRIRESIERLARKWKNPANR